jgi:hypothetical protein
MEPCEQAEHAKKPPNSWENSLRLHTRNPGGGGEDETWLPSCWHFCQFSHSKFFAMIRTFVPAK